MTCSITDGILYKIETSSWNKYVAQLYTMYTVQNSDSHFHNCSVTITLKNTWNTMYCLYFNPPPPSPSYGELDKKQNDKIKASWHMTWSCQTQVSKLKMKFLHTLSQIYLASLLNRDFKTSLVMGLLPLIMEHMGLIPLSVLSSLCSPFIHVIIPHPSAMAPKGHAKSRLD